MKSSVNKIEIKKLEVRKKEIYQIFKKNDKKVKLLTAKFEKKTQKGENVYHYCNCQSGCSKKLGRVGGKKSKFGFRFYCKTFDCHNLQNSQLDLCQDCREKYFGMKKRVVELDNGSSEYYHCEECDFEIRVGDHPKPYGWAEKNVMKFGFQILKGADVSMRFTKNYLERVKNAILKHKEQTGHFFNETDEEIFFGENNA